MLRLRRWTGRAGTPRHCSPLWTADSSRFTDDHAAQEAAFYGAPEWQRGASALRERLTEREIDATHPLVHFIGIDAYTTAGGGIRRDLFAEGDAGTYLTDAALLETLVRGKLDALAGDVRAEGWAWVEAVPHMSYAERQAFQNAPRQRREPSAREARRIASLQTCLDKIDAELEEAYDAEDEDKTEALEPRREQVVDCGGGEPARPYARAAAFQSLGYRVMVVRDDDKKPTPVIEQAFLQAGGAVVAYRAGRALEDELFGSLTPVACQHLIKYAHDLHGDLIHEHLRTVSNNTLTVQAVWDEIQNTQALSVPNRVLLGQAARIRKAGWFKSISWMEDVARTIVAPDLPLCDPGFKALVDQVSVWAAHGPR